ncbi:MAG TPA: DUF6491 family protein [Phenylobacterium sp.]|jgi:hypothetical protein
MNRHLPLAAVLLALAATSVVAAPSDTSGHTKRSQCFWTRNADGFAAADEHTLNVRVGVRDVYQFEMFGTCQGLDWDQRIALVSRSGGTICTGMDAEVISQAPGFGRQRCPVRSVRKLTAEEVAALPKRAKP